MPSIVTDSFDYNDLIRVLDQDEAFVHHQIEALQPKYWRLMLKSKLLGQKIFAPVMVSGNRGIDYMIFMVSRSWQITKKQRMLDYTMTCCVASKWRKVKTRLCQPRCKKKWEKRIVTRLLKGFRDTRKLD